MLLILLATVCLVAWALYLMQKAMEDREFSLMLAGFLVVSAAAALVTAYFMLGDYRGYVQQQAIRYDDYPQRVELSDLDFWNDESAAPEISGLAIRTPDIPEGTIARSKSWKF